MKKPRLTLAVAAFASLQIFSAPAAAKSEHLLYCGDHYFRCIQRGGTGYAGPNMTMCGAWYESCLVDGFWLGPYYAPAPKYIDNNQ